MKHRAAGPRISDLTKVKSAIRHGRHPRFEKRRVREGGGEATASPILVESLALTLPLPPYLVFAKQLYFFFTRLVKRNLPPPCRQASVTYNQSRVRLSTTVVLQEELPAEKKCSAGRIGSLPDLRQFLNRRGKAPS